MGTTVGFIIGIAIFMVLGVIISVATRYKRCPSDKILVISGKTKNRSDGSANFAKCIHGGAKFVWPLIQEYSFLDLTPMAINVELRSALSKQNIRVDVPCRFTVGISTEPGIMQNAAERLMCRNLNEIIDLAREMIMGQMRLVVANMCIEEINSDRDKFLNEITKNVETELKKIGLKLFNVNVTDITDESGYIVALGREAAATAINEARVKVADAERMGAVGEADAMMEKRVRVASAESSAIDGENKAQAEIANSQASLREKQAEALRRAVASEKIQAANALEEAYQAEKKAELARASRDQATQEADIIVKTEIDKRRMEIDAEAVAEQTRRKARGEAEAIYMKMEAEARGIQEILTKQAQGLKDLVGAAGGNADDAFRLIVSQKLEELVRTQVEAIKNIKIDKITVWDNGGSDGKTSTANFMSGLFKSIPPLEELFGMAGLTMPRFINPNPEVSNKNDSPEEQA